MFDVSSPILGCFFTTIFDVSTTFDPKKNSMFRTAFEAFCNGETKASTATPMSFPSTVSPWPPKNVSVRPLRIAPQSPARSNWRSPDGATEICRNRWSVWCVIMMRCLFCLFMVTLLRLQQRQHSDPHYKGCCPLIDLLLMHLSVKD